MRKTFDTTPVLDVRLGRTQVLRAHEFPRYRGLGDLDLLSVESDLLDAAFISKDPARADGEMSAYGYCGGEPLGEVDPEGTKAKWIGSNVRSEKQKQVKTHLMYNWCWAAASVAVIKKRHPHASVTQEMLAREMRGSSGQPNGDAALNAAASDEQILSALRDWGVTSAAVVSGPLSKKDLRSRLKKQHPVIAVVNWFWSDGSDSAHNTHALVVEKITTDLKWVQYMDPGDGKHKRARYGDLLETAGKTANHLMKADVGGKVATEWVRSFVN